jgi:hypothetical protein
LLEEAKTKSASWVYVVRWNNNPKAKGMGYLLNDHSVGVVVKDKAKIISGNKQNENELYHYDINQSLDAKFTKETAGD